jgi:hypothetical protein
MLKRNLDVYGDYKDLFSSLFKESLASLNSKSETNTIFHEMLADRVADSYVEIVQLGESTKKTETKEKVLREKLQKWLSMVFQEIHSLSAETASRQAFYKQISTVISDVIDDVELRKKLLTNLLDVMRKNKIDVG